MSDDQSKVRYYHVPGYSGYLLGTDRKIYYKKLVSQHIHKTYRWELVNCSKDGDYYLNTSSKSKPQKRLKLQDVIALVQKTPMPFFVKKQHGGTWAARRRLTQK